MPDAVRAQAADAGKRDGAAAPAPPAPKPPAPAPPRRRRRLGVGRFGLGRWLGLGLAAALTVVRVWDPAAVEVLRLKTFDLYQLIRPRQAPAQPVVIVDIDEESLEKLGQWPWSRTIIADMVDRIQGAGAAALGFDVVFAEPDRMSPASVAKHMPGLAGDLRRRLRDLPSNDTLLAQSLAKARVVLGQSGYPRVLGMDDSPVAGPAIATLGGKPGPFLIRFPGLVRNIAVLESAAPGHGFFTLLPERDGIVRRVPAILMVRGQVVPALSIEMLRVASGQDAILVKTDEAGVYAIGVAGAEIPTDRIGRIWVNYTRHDPGRYVSAAALLSGAVAPERLAGKLVLLGTSATGLFDAKATPLDAALPGVEVHVLTALIGLVMVGLVPILGAVTTLGLGSAIAIGLSAGSWYLYTREMLLIDVAYPMVASLAVYVTLVFVNYFREEAQRRQVRGAFSQYLSPELVEQLAR
ncbi:MAG: CHASE2 domain-containing protein, partial [Kiloniellaceae bacterium]